MRAYHNDPQVKAKYVARFAAHRAADEVIQGSGFSGGRGCFVGCTLNRYAHHAFPGELGWPVWMAHLADGIFEGLPEEDAPQFGTDLLDAVPVGADLGRVRLPFLLLLQRRNLARLRDAPEPYGEVCRRAVQGVIGALACALTSTQGEAGEITDEAMLAALAVRRAQALPSPHMVKRTLASALAATRLEPSTAAGEARYVASMDAWGAAPWQSEAMRQRDDLISLVRGV